MRAGNGKLWPSARPTEDVNYSSIHVMTLELGNVSSMVNGYELAHNITLSTEYSLVSFLESYTRVYSRKPWVIFEVWHQNFRASYRVVLLPPCLICTILGFAEALFYSGR
jgi:hypothetical protein